ncbi:Y-family DNA polymerase [Roseixanthobacter liquoris]|uniref:Y-family DNA polymerase n=1 Tax=Roseixanthobacter liquoris TaxID=3119921 RepID=UPI003729499A
MTPSPAPGRRYLCLWLNHLSTDRIARSLPLELRAAPRATLVLEKSALRLAALNPAARDLGLVPGLSLADARARHPELQVADHAPEADARLLGHVADACERYTPLLALDAPDALMLDVSGCAHLFGGERALVGDLRARVGARGYATRAALASTLGAAWALAHFGARPALVVEEGADLAALLAPLPLAALRLEAGALAALARLGFTRIGDLAGKPRAPLTARFGTDLLRRLDQATGLAREAVEHRFPPPRFCAERSLSDPIERTEDVLGLAHHLATKLAPALERAGKGARRLELTLFRVDGQVTRLTVGASRPLRDPLAIRRLFAEKMAQVAHLDAGFGFDLLRLGVTLAEDMAPHQHGFDARQAEEAALDGLVDRLSARFGAARVQHLGVLDAHLPEEAGQATALARRRLPFDAGALADPARIQAQILAGSETLEAGPGQAFASIDKTTPPLPSQGAPAPGGRQREQGGGESQGEDSGQDERAGQAIPFPARARSASPPADGDRPSPVLIPVSIPLPRASAIRTGAAETRPPAPARSAAAGGARESRAPQSPAGALSLTADVPQPKDPPEDPAMRPPAHPPFATPPARSETTGAHLAPSPPTLRDRDPAADVPLAPGAIPPARAAARRAPAPPAPAERPDADGAVRPQRLFAVPEAVEAVAEVPDGAPVRFRWRRRLHLVARVEGPERIAAPWWREPALRLTGLPPAAEPGAGRQGALSTPTRDYFRVETKEGLRLWLFRAGLYGAETSRPAWYVHGLFA